MAATGPRSRMEVTDVEVFEGLGGAMAADGSDHRHPARRCSSRGRVRRPAHAPTRIRHLDRRSRANQCLGAQDVDGHRHRSSGGRCGRCAPFIAAAPNIDSFVNTFDTPGVRYIAFAYAPDPQTLVTEYGLEAGCASIAVQPYTDGTFTGVVQVGTECGSGLATWNMVVASPADLSFTAVVQVQTASPVDQQALDVVLASFNVASGTAPSATPLPGPATVPVAPLPAGAAPLPTTPVTGAPLPTLAPAQVPVTAGVPGQTAPAGQTLTITDDTNRLTVQVPAAWAQTDTAPSANGNAFIVASPNLASYNSLDDALALSVPALIFMGGSFMADTASAITFVSGLGDGCTPTEVTPYDDGVFVGHVQVSRTAVAPRH